MKDSHNKTVFDILDRLPVHPFPARMAPGIALDALECAKKPMRVLDPMMGSGTVLAVAKSRGHRAFGIDIDPLAVLLSKVWTTGINPDRVLVKADQVLDRARIMLRNMAVREAYPATADEETRQFIRYWFDNYTRCQLTALSRAIRRVRHDAIRDVLWCGFSRLIITKSAGASLAMDLSHSRPHKSYARAPVKPFNQFLKAIATVASNCPHRRSNRIGPRTNVQCGDARRLRINSSSIDLVLTSPPYLNAIDYIRCSKFSLVWMGYVIRDLRRLRSQSVGAERTDNNACDSGWATSFIRQMRLRPALSKRNQGVLVKYVCDMNNAITEVSRVLRNGGRAVYVVGDSNIKGTFVRNSLIVEQLACKHGMKLISRQSRILPANRRYLPPPKRSRATHALDGRMRKEIVLMFEKSK